MWFMKELYFKHIIQIQSNCGSILFLLDFQVMPHIEMHRIKEKIWQCFIKIIFSHPQVFGNAPPNTMTEKFSDLLQFTTQVSRLMVTEIRRRASNKSTGIFTETIGNWFIWIDSSVTVLLKLNWKLTWF